MQMQMRWAQTGKSIEIHFLLLSLDNEKQVGSQKVNRQCGAMQRSVPAAIQTQIALHVHEVQKAVGSISQALCQRQALHGSLAAMASLSQGPAQNSR